MKRCSYCGKEYSDDAVVCSIDQTPFEDVSLEGIRIGLPTFAVVSKHKIPLSLAIVSYIWFLPAASCFGLIGFILLMLFISGGSSGSGLEVLICAIGLVGGIFFYVYPEACEGVHPDGGPVHLCLFGLVLSPRHFILLIIWRLTKCQPMRLPQSFGGVAHLHLRGRHGSIEFLHGRMFALYLMDKP